MKVKNIGVYAHVDAGKTTITENLLYESNIINSLGRVDNGTSYTDDLSIERRRGISIQSAPVSFNLGNTKINLIDTPGHADFIAEVERSMNVLDGAILVISAKEGVQAQTYLIFDSLMKLNVPTIIFINKIDRIGVNIESVMKSIRESLSEFIIQVQSVNTNDQSVSSLFNYDSTKMLETLAIKDDELLANFIYESIDRQDIINSCIKLAKSGEVYPVLFGSALKQIGTEQLIEAINAFLPESELNTTGEIAGTVFKIKHIDNTKLTYIRLYSGCLKTRDFLEGEKITKIESLDNGKLKQTDTLNSNDIGVVYGPDIKVNHTFGETNRKNISLGEPTSKIKISAKEDYNKHNLVKALNIITKEDPFLEYELSEIKNDIYINIFGEIQLEILAERLLTEFNINVEFDNVQTIFKETPKSVGEYSIELYDKKFPFYAGVGCKVEPLSAKSGVEIVSNVSTGHLLKTFQNGILDGINRYINQGLMGWPLTDIKVTITKGNYDSVMSTPSDFRDLTPIVFMKALEISKTKLLWPILEFRLKVPKSSIGKVLAEISSMNATFEKPINKGSVCLIHGFIPSHLCRNYELKLRTYTKGEGIFSTKFSHYAAAPSKIKTTREKVKIDPSNVTTYLMAKRGIIK